MNPVDQPPRNNQTHKRFAIGVIVLGVLCLLSAIVLGITNVNDSYDSLSTACTSKTPPASCATKLHRSLTRTRLDRKLEIGGFALIAAGGVYLAYAEGRLPQQRK